MLHTFRVCLNGQKGRKHADIAKDRTHNYTVGTSTLIPPPHIQTSKITKKITSLCLLNSAPEGLPVQATWEYSSSLAPVYSNMARLHICVPHLYSRIGGMVPASGAELTLIPLPTFCRSTSVAVGGFRG